MKSALPKKYKKHEIDILNRYIKEKNATVDCLHCWMLSIIEISYLRIFTRQPVKLILIKIYR